MSLFFSFCWKERGGSEAYYSEALWREEKVAPESYLHLSFAVRTLPAAFLGFPHRKKIYSIIFRHSLYGNRQSLFREMLY